MATLHRSAAERLRAWIVTGPIGHGYGGIVDFVVVLGRVLWAKARSEVTRRIKRRP